LRAAAPAWLTEAKPPPAAPVKAKAKASRRMRRAAAKR
jgi:hypothetical protein